jgi:multisubunit Na+/H+ antiporter MnhB subunit
VVIAMTAVGLGWRCVLVPDRFESVALFIGIGVVMSLAWARLAAPDLALAEAALGTGLIGAMLLAAWAQTRGGASGRVDRPVAVVAGVLALVGMAVVTLGVVPLLGESAGLAQRVAANIGATGVSNPVTGVLLDFRAFDTLLELCVLLAALAATWQLGDARPMLHGKLRGAVFLTYTRIVIPLLIVLAGALLWRGATAPGGAFQAGAVLAAAGVLLLLSTPAGRAPRHPLLYRVGVSLGVFTFLGLGLSMLLVTGRFLDWPPAAAGALVLVVEAAATVAIGLTLALLLIGGRPVAGGPDVDSQRGKVE